MVLSSEMIYRNAADARNGLSPLLSGIFSVHCSAVVLQYLGVRLVLFYCVEKVEIHTNSVLLLPYFYPIPALFYFPVGCTLYFLSQGEICPKLFRSLHIS